MLARRDLAPKRARALVVAIAAPALVALVTHVAIAQPRKPGPAPTHARPAPPKKVSPPASASAAAPAPSPATASTSALDAGVVEARTLDGGTRVFKFGEMEIEGRLKSPQLVYFLRRVRAEFAAGDLGHRTFLREMSETRKEPSF